MMASNIHEYILKIRVLDARGARPCPGRGVHTVLDDAHWESDHLDPAGLHSNLQVSDTNISTLTDNFYCARVSLQWLILCCLSLSLNGSNLLGYTRARLGTSEAVTKRVTSWVMSTVLRRRTRDPETK